MPNRNHSEEQIAAILKEIEDGGSVLDVSKKHRLLPRTIRRWKEKYAALQDAEVKEPWSLEEENARLKKMVVNLSVLATT